MGPPHRRIRIAAVPIVAAGIALCGTAIFAEQLGLGTEVARGVFGWKRLSLLVAGAAVLIVGALLLVRPQVFHMVVDSDQLEPVDRYVRIVAALIAAAGLAASGLAILSDELGVGTAAAEGAFGWKRISLLVLGGIAFALGALLSARPRIVSARVDWERVQAGWARMRANWRRARSNYRRRMRSSRAWMRSRLARGRGYLFDPPRRHLCYLAIGLLALLGLALVWTRLVHIGHSFWHDEAVTVLRFSGVGPGAIVLGEGGFSTNNHAVYNLLSWLTTNVLGESEAMYRLWSVLPGIAAIGIGAWWAWRRLGPVVAVAFATIAVAGPLHLEYVPQARGYGLALLAATLTLITADRLARSYSNRTLLGFVGAGLLGIWTLLIFAAVFVGQALALLRWPNLRAPVIAAVAAAGILSLAFYAPVSEGVAGAGAGGTTTPLTAALLLDRPLEWLVIPTVTLLIGEGERASLIGSGVAPDAPWATWLDLGVFGLLVLGLVALWRRGEGGLALILVVPPLFFNIAFSLRDETMLTRHQLFLLPYIVVPVAAGIAELGRTAAQHRLLRPVSIGVGVAAVLTLSAAIVIKQEDRNLPREGFQQVANVVHGAGIDTVVTDSVRPRGLLYYLGEDLEELMRSEVQTLLCDRRREMIYVRHLPYGPDDSRYRSPASLDCLAGADSVRVRVPQRFGSRAIDVWIVRPRASRETSLDDLG